jgi:hypothetical protein
LIHSVSFLSAANRRLMMFIAYIKDTLSSFFSPNLFPQLLILSRK